MKTYLDYLATSRPEAAKANPKEFVDLSFVQEVQASGFIRQLFRPDVYVEQKQILALIAEAERGA